MALTRRFLNALGIEAEKVDQIIEGHSEAVEALKAQRDEAKAEAEALRTEAEKVPGLEKQVEELSNAPKEGDEWKAKYDEEHESFEAFKAQVEADRVLAEKAGAYRSLLRDAGVEERFIDDIMGVTDLSGIAFEDGKLADAEGVKKVVSEKYATFIPQKRTDGAKVDDPPAADPNVFDGMSLADKMQYANANPNDPAVRAWLAN